jgi:CO/xanthine dehydrogenase Mo-binding subunit
LPTFSDVPPIFKTFVIEGEGGPGPYGAKGMGEGGILPVAPAVGNAVFAAVGKRMQAVPLTPGAVWEGINKKR